MPEASHACPDFRRAVRLSRRQLLTAGGLYATGLLLPDLLRARAAQVPQGSFGRARSVIVLYLHGGHAQQETWDPKPDAPQPARGEFGAIATSVPGVRVSELLPRSARLMHQLAIIRSLSHANANHVQASLPAMTGHAHPPEAEARGDFPPSSSDFPPVGAVLDALRPAAKVPTWVQVGPLMRRANGTVLHGQSPGFLGSRHGPLVVDQDLRPADVRVEAGRLDPELSAPRLVARGDFLRLIDGQRRLLDRVAEVQTFDAYQQKALGLLTSSATARAFDLAAEPEAVRARYGRTEFGQRCLLARRLAEAGVPVVNVHYCRTPDGSWDTHGRHFSQMKESLCPTFDQTFTALVDDLHGRGLLGQVLVLATAEFGRTPKVNGAGGRDHWPWVYSVALAGGGTAAGVVYGASDPIAAQPRARPHAPADLAATVYHLLGVPPETVVHDPTNRPHALVTGRKIDGLLA
jgi:uncharacterized protein (DUF1501 family)